MIRDPGVGAEKVELFLATRAATTSSIGANVSRTNETRDKLRGDSYFLDGPGDGTTPMTMLDVVDGQVVWNLQADPARPSRMKLVVAVAYNGQGQVVGIAKMYDVDVPADDAVAYVLQLEGAKQIAPSDSMDPAGLRVWPWRKANAPTTAACLGIEHSDGNGHLERTWLVPEDDPDCDEATIECDEFLYRADYSDAASTCIIPAVVVSPTHIPCKLGQKSCQDNVTAGACVPLSPPYCLASALCDPEACFDDPAACENIKSSGVSCEMAVQKGGGVCDQVSLGGGPLRVALGSSNGLFPTGCDAVAFATPDPVRGFIPTSTAMIGGALFAIEGLSNTQCAFSIEPTGLFDANMSGGTPLLLVLDVTSGGAHYVVPVFVKVRAGACESSSPICVTIQSPDADLAGCQ